MESLQGTADILRKAALLTLIGVLVVFLIGPVLSLIGLILPFALVGFLVWIPYRLLVQKKQVNWTGVPRHAGRVLRTVFAVPLWIGARVVAIAKGLLHLIGGLIGLVFRIVIPAFAGAFLFALLGTIGGIQHQDAEYRIPAAALIGAGIGALYGVFRTRPTQKVIVLRAAPAVGVRE